MNKLTREQKNAAAAEILGLDSLTYFHHDKDDNLIYRTVACGNGEREDLPIWNPCKDANQLPALRAEIDKKGLSTPYMDELLKLTGVTVIDRNEYQLAWLITNATPEQHVDALIKAWKGK